MKYSYCEKLMWLAMNGVIFKLLEEKTPDVDCKQWKKKSKERYKQIISELDEIGDMMKNPLRVSLSGGAVWMAVYETAPNKIVKNFSLKWLLQQWAHRLSRKPLAVKIRFL